MTTNGRTEDRDGAAEADPVTTAVRLALGTASLSVEALATRLRAWGREASPTVRFPAGGDGSVADAVIGMAARGARRAASLGVRGAGAVRTGLRRAEGATGVLGRLVPTFLDEPIDRARDRARRRLERLEADGREEMDRSRTVARNALNEGLDAVLTRLANSRELHFVVRTQGTSPPERERDPDTRSIGVGRPGD